MSKELETIVNKAVSMFENGANVSQIRAYLDSQRSFYANSLLVEVAERVGITLDELKFETGESFGVTRFQRPRVTYGFIVGAIVGMLLNYRRDMAKVRKEVRSNSTVGGVKLGRKFHKKYLAAKTQKAKDAMLDVRLGDVLNGAFKIKLFRRGGMISRRYVFTESKSAWNIVKRKASVILGKKYMYIPTTAHGHSDQCRPFEGRYWAIDSGVRLPPYHPNCKHYVIYSDNLPSNQKVSSPSVAESSFEKLT